MAIFPELIPSTRTYSPGAFPHTAHRVYDGSEARVRHSNAVLGVRLRLFFPALTSAELLTVIAHYNAQRGRFLPFAIPDDLLSGVDTPADFTPSGHQWRYAAKPTAEDVSVDDGTNLHNLTVELETVPPENSIVQGARLRAFATLRPGSAQLGTFLDVVASLSAGEAFAALDLSVQVFLDAGSPFPVVNFDVVATLAAGEFISQGTNELMAFASLAAGAASSTFDPLSLSPAVWWDASDTGTVTTSSSLVTDWVDKSGNERHLSQATSGRQPTYVSSAINGLHAIQWPSTNNPMSLDTAAANITVKEVYVVLEFDGTGFGNYEGILASLNNSLSQTICGQASGNGLTVTDLPAYVNGNNSTNMNTDVFPEIESPSLWRFVIAGSGWATTSGLTVGMDRALNHLNRGWNGYIAEVLVFPTVLSTGDRGDLETHLMDKWGI